VDAPGPEGNPPPAEAGGGKGGEAPDFEATVPPGAGERDPLRWAVELRDRGEPFALATVVARSRPQAARPGARAVVRLDGRVEGWLGGGCVTTVVKKEALAALQEGRPRLVVIGDGEPGAGSPAPGGAADPDRRVYPMTCRGEGRVEVHVEPFLPAPVLAILGGGPVAVALARIGGIVGFRIVGHRGFGGEGLEPHAHVLLDENEGLDGGFRGELHLVVATMGDGDEDALVRCGEAGADSVHLVASPGKGGRLLEAMAQQGLPRAFLETVRYPAGLDLGGSTPAEIALSVAAELVRLRSADDEGRDARAGSAPGPASPDPSRRFATDPVCGMAVEVEGARHVSRSGGRTYYFCGPGCRRRFQDDPDAYTSGQEG